MLARLRGWWRRQRELAERAEAHLAKIAETLAASEARMAGAAARMEGQLLQLNNMSLHLSRIEHQMAMAHPRYSAPLRLERFGHKVFSQNDEDGIIAEIFRRIGTSARTFIEIAAGDGKENCSAFLLSQGWRGLWVECSANNLRSINAAWPQEIASGQLKVSSDFVSAETVNDTIAAANLGDDIDLVIIDIDGNDYHILKALEIRPRVICAEYFAPKPPPIGWYMPYDRNYNINGDIHPMSGGACGASLQAYEDLLTPLGYSLVGTSIAGVNCFFVRSDLVGDKFEAPFTAFNHYNSARYWYPVLSLQSQIWTAPPNSRP